MPVVASIRLVPIAGKSIVSILDMYVPDSRPQPKINANTAVRHIQQAVLMTADARSRLVPIAGKPTASTKHTAVLDAITFPVQTVPEFIVLPMKRINVHKTIHIISANIAE